MHLIIIGCEYVGKTTLANGIKEWMMQTMGGCESSFHDHFVPWTPEADGAKGERMKEQLLSLEPSLLECYQRYMIHYHTSPSFYALKDHCVVNWYYADAVYAALYYGFGGPGQYAERSELARYYDKRVIELAPDTVLVLVKASPEAIRQRRNQASQPTPFPKEEDVELVLKRFEEEYSNSLLHQKFMLDTTDASAEETLAEFVRQIEPHLTAADRQRISARQAAQH